MIIKDGGTVKVGKGSQGNVGIEVRSSKKLVVESGGTLTGGAGAGGIELLHSGNSGAVVTGVSGTFIDRGQTLTENGQVTVAAATEAPTNVGLTAESIPGTATPLKNTTLPVSRSPPADRPKISAWPRAAPCNLPPWRRMRAERKWMRLCET
ncbi:MAG: hypothetical protein ACLSB9_32690 [Hydrogeniiclostridium mannosilyticum]